jgi:sporulation protein YlmC with PRC-barrel domain
MSVSAVDSRARCWRKMAAGKSGNGFPSPELSQIPFVVGHLQQWRNPMIRKTLATALLTTALMSGTAFAQTATNKADTATTSTMHKEGEWRASKLVGVNVYNEANEKIGDINEVILEKSGKVASVILGVGGFLGMGEHYVSVAFDKLKWVNEPAGSTVSTSNAPATNVDSNARTASDDTAKTTGVATTTTRHANDNWYPDHAVLNATKDQLKTVPQFEY